MSKKTVLSIILLSALVFPGTWLVSAQDKQTLTVFAASSLTNAFNDIADAFTAKNPDVDIVFNFGSSSTLAAQLAQGAPGDVFASANQKQMQVAVDAGRIVEPTAVFARNRLIIIVPADNPAAIQSPRDLATSGLQLVLAAPGVPVRDYTDSMLEKLSADPAYGATFQPDVMANVVSEEDNVRQVVAKVSLGEAQAGVVYFSDVTPDVSDLIMSIPVPDAVNTIAAYPIGITSDSAAPELAQAFVDFILSDDGQAILKHWNFIGKCPDMQAEATPESTPEATPEAEMTEIPDASPTDAGCSQ
jgi:molybdate transport system substrate-binding protein